MPAKKPLAMVTEDEHRQRITESFRIPTIPDATLHPNNDFRSSICPRCQGFGRDFLGRACMYCDAFNGHATSGYMQVLAIPPQRKHMLEKAHELINSDREADYGPPKANFQRIADRWTQVFGHPVSPQQVAQCMIEVKMARLCQTPDHADTWLDIAGYVGAYDRIVNE